MPAVTVDAIRQVWIVLGLKVTRVVQLRRCVALLAVDGNFGLKLAQALRRVLLMRVLIALLWPVTVGTEDRCRRMDAVYGTVQLNGINSNIQRFAGSESNGLRAADMAKLAG